MTSADHHFNLRIDATSAEAIRREAKRQNKTLSAFMREALQARLDSTLLAEPLRLAVSDALDESSRRLSQRINEEMESAIARVVEQGTHERELVRSMIGEFIAGLTAVMEQLPSSTPPPASSQEPRIR